MSIYELRIGGMPATEIAPHTPPTWETLATGGCGEASWAFAMTPRQQHQYLRAGVEVTISVGGIRVYRGRLNEPDRTTWECKARGMASDTYRYAAVDVGGNSTNDLNTAINGAYIRGLIIGNPLGLTGTITGDLPDQPRNLGESFDAYVAQLGWRWGLDENANLYMQADATTPTWATAPGVAVFGSADDDYISAMLGIYDDGTGVQKVWRVNSSAQLLWNRSEDVVDLTDRGTLTLAQATAILDSMLATAAKPTPIGSMTLSSAEFQTIGGSRGFLPAVRGGQMFRAHGLESADQQAQMPWRDVLIGKTSHTAGEDAIYIEPADAAPRTFTDVIAAT